MSRTDMHPEDIKAQIRKRGQTLEGLAREHALSGQSVRNALRTPVRAGELVIAHYLGKQPQEIWPSRWAQDGGRLTTTNRSQSRQVSRKT